MLVLKREAKQTLVIDGPCVIYFDEIGTRHVKVGIEAPHSTKILRGELVPLPKAPTNENNAAECAE